MKTITRLLTIAALTLSSAVLAQHNHAGHMAPAQAEGVIKKVDAKAASVTIAHGPIANLNMPAMTMSFKAKEPAMLAKLKAGDKVRFHSAEENGALTVISIETVK